MTKAELVAAVAEKADITKKDAEAAVKATFEAVANALKAGDKVAVAGFGTFSVKKRAARTATNPQTKEKVELPETTVPAFKAGKALKDLVK